LTPHLAFNGELWMTAQTVAYSSPDGLAWTQHSKTDWGARIYHGIVYFKGKLWMLGGLDYQARTFLNDIWSSADGVTWARAGAGPWSGRGSQAMVVYRDRLWLIGGADHVASDRSTDGFLNDVWVSDDGLNWRMVTAAAPWAATDEPVALVFRDALYLIGGQARSEVWRSTDGEQWTQVASSAGWGLRHGYGRAVLDGKVWVFGGWRDRPTDALNDVWYSSDGVTWTLQTEHAPWAPRLPISLVFDDKIWIFSGKHTGAQDNWGGDMWTMHLDQGAG
jgi:N-acetylneuraminic acid mutarotase